ncbi:MAG: cytochrome c oxidase subunit II [Planctomycetes bacterium]|nr:cytochrome c oxidase subunit II [Planctomycetota bacterium]
MTFLTSMLATVPVPTGQDVGGGFWLPPSHSTAAESVDWVFYLIYWICVFFFLLIMVLMGWFIYKYRRRPGVAAEKTVTHHTALELAWTIIPLILVIMIFYVGLKGYVNLVEPPKNAYEVNVTGQQWSWNFEHRNGVADANLLTVPVNRPVKLIMTSTDVLHSVFIPSFRVKQDVVPGRYTYLWFEAKEPGLYQLLCSEYCGTDHSQMTATVEVLPQEEFEAVMEIRSRVFDTTPIEEYPSLFLARLYPRCAACHTLDDTIKQGPGFRQTYQLWGSERLLDDGRKVKVDENYIRKSLLNPQADIVPGVPGKMTTFQGQLKEREIIAVIEFFKRLDEVVDEQGNRR